MPKKAPAQWSVAEKKDDWIRIAQTGSYMPDEWWPRVGETLIVKPKPKGTK